MILSPTKPQSSLIISRPQGTKIIEKLYGQLYKEGAKLNEIFFIIRGEVAIFRKNDQGRNIRLPALEQGEFVGIQAAYGSNTASHSARVTKSAKLLVIPLAQFTNFTKRWPSVKEEIIAQLINRADLLSET